MHELTKLISDDMCPALGVTEPGAIAFAVSTAKQYINGEIDHVELALNSGMYKNAFTCGIPNSPYLGNYYAAALGVVCADPSKGLECLSGLTEEHNQIANEMVQADKIEVSMVKVTSRIFIQAIVHSGDNWCAVTIQDSHTHITSIIVNGDAVMGDSTELPLPLSENDGKESIATIHRYTLAEILEYIETVPVEEISFINKAFDVNMTLARAAHESKRTSFASPMLEMNGGKLFSEDEQLSALATAAAAIEARVLGEDLPAMAITGSGSHGILCTLPLYAVAQIRQLPEEKLLRATALSYLVCMYIKEYSGKLSAFCGCGIAGGTGAACSLTWLNGGDLKALEGCINNMASSITGMICDGGNHGCVLKAVSAIDAMFRCSQFALAGVSISGEHAINGLTPEDTMHNMGLIASPGMTATEATIVEIMKNK